MRKLKRLVAKTNMKKKGISKLLKKEQWYELFCTALARIPVNYYQEV